jgi:hypothetical protein
MMLIKPDVIVAEPLGFDSQLQMLAIETVVLAAARVDAAERLLQSELPPPISCSSSDETRAL